jgi:hypothetical protein
MKKFCHINLLEFEKKMYICGLIMNLNLNENLYFFIVFHVNEQFKYASAGYL